MALFNTPTKSQLIQNAGKQIDSLVFLALNVNDINNGWVVEISLVAVQMAELRRKRNEENKIPRIVDKLTLNIDPVVSCEPHLCFTSKTSNFLIKEATKKCFDHDVFKLIQLFLQRQYGQVCLLSHSGFRHDFQVLQLELDRLEMSLGLVNSLEIWCADSLWTFKEMDSRVEGKSVWKTGASILDMFSYTLSSLYTRYLNHPMSVQQTAEERNICLLELVCKTLDPFLENICCKKFAFVSRANRNFRCQPNNGQVIPINDPLLEAENGGKMTQTYIFLDLETTGLVKPKITEISMIAIHDSSMKSGSMDKLPRVQDKLLLVIEPEKEISPKASELTGLTNANIKNSFKLPFDSETCLAIRHFIKRQSGPVCLVAHNGSRFDFPILREALQRLLGPVQFGQLYCSDTLTCLRSLQKIPTSIFFELPSLKLQDVYAHCVQGHRMEWHTSENDAEVLIQIVKHHPEILTMLDSMKVSFI